MTLPTNFSGQRAFERSPDSHLAIGLDIGSTFTKGALFRLEGRESGLVRREAVPTTVEHLPDGALTVVRMLLDLPTTAGWDDVPADPPIFLTSSAKGGLRVSVVGLVPDLSLHIGRLTAWSAGARIISAHPYRLSDGAIAEFERDQPDILLLCGGTDGGHERTGRENAEKLARSVFAGTIIYAGNAMIADEIRAILSGKSLVITENVMPEFGRFNGDPAREAIRAVFLREIVSGKGLKLLVDRLGTEPVPTPRAMFDLIGAIADHCHDWGEFVALDLGGATTDVYSCSEAYRGGEGVILRGIVEPMRKRSVEGDLGLRVSAQSLLSVLESEPNSPPIADIASTYGFVKTPSSSPKSERSPEETGPANRVEAFESLRTWVGRVSTDTSLLPKTLEEEASDADLAAGCVRHAIRRHAGHLEPAWTPAGRVWLQTGKDLRPIQRLVLTGGYPASHADLDLYAAAAASSPECLVPLAPTCFVDHLYIWPLLGALVARFPVEAARLAIATIRATNTPLSSSSALSSPRHHFEGVIAS